MHTYCLFAANIVRLIIGRSPICHKSLLQYIFERLIKVNDRTKI
jgi:hypothetical protein